MTTIERIARAIAKSANPHKGAETGWYAWIPEARAALSAMMNPSEAMVSAAESFDIANGRGGWVNMDESEFRNLNRDVIQSALDEK